MFRVLLICAVASVCTGKGDRNDVVPRGVKGVRSLDQGFGSYLRSVRDLEQLVALVDRRVVDKKYDVLEPELHYLVVVGVVLRTARSVLNSRVNVKEVYALNLDEVVPDVLADPGTLVNQVHVVKKSVVQKLQLLVDTVLSVCEENLEVVCNQLVEEEVRRKPELQRLLGPLLTVGHVARVAVSEEKAMVKDLKNLGVVPYLVQNEDDLVRTVELLAEVLTTLGVGMD